MSGQRSETARNDNQSANHDIILACKRAVRSRCVGLRALLLPFSLTADDRTCSGRGQMVSG
jgi:hypothetical protein